MFLKLDVAIIVFLRGKDLPFLSSSGNLDLSYKIFTASANFDSFQESRDY